MEILTDSFKQMQLRKALFTESVNPDEEDTLNVSSWKTGFSTRRSLSTGNIHDEDFYPPEAGRAMILRDQATEPEARNMLENFTSCSSWAINSQQHHPCETFDRTVNQQCQELFVAFKECSGFSASTPKLDRPMLFPTTPAVLKTEDTVLKSSVGNHHDRGFVRRDSALFPMLLYSTTAASEFNAPKIFGTTKRKNTQTLESGEISKDPSRAPSSSKTISSCQSLDFHDCYDSTLKASALKAKSVPSLNGEGDLWIVQPQALELDANGKGRLLLINKSSYRNLKFKIVFDCKLINVCPQSGNLKSKSSIGLRVLVSRCVKDREKIPEDVIRIMCGNTEKRVPVKICKVQKIISTKDRSFRCF